MPKLHPHSNAVKQHQIVIFASPSNPCWQCEQALPAEPSAVAAGTFATKCGLAHFVYVLCSTTCGRALAEELALPESMLRFLQPAETIDILRAPENVIGVVEGWQGPDRPYYQVRGPLFDSIDAEAEAVAMPKLA
jgi:hypothetical protein